MPTFRLEDYETVEERLRRFWEGHPNGRVMTTLIHHGEGQYIVYAEVWRTEGQLPAASGLAEEKEGSTFVNKTSALENCETSAVGRALAQLGLAPSGKRPSREEMSKTSPVAGGQGPPSPALDPGGSTSADGEAAATGTGGGRVSSLTAATSGPTTCNHKSASGRWLKTMQVEGVPVCPRCGASAILYRESG